MNNRALHIRMVDPHNLDIDRGELADVIEGSSSVSFGYNTDTRTSASVKTLGSNYIPGSWLRILYGEKEIGTYVVRNTPSVEYGTGGAVYSYELQSVLWTLSEDLCPSHFSIGSGTYALDVFDRICRTCGRDFVHMPEARNYRYTTSKIYEAGESYLSLLFDVCSASNNRLDVDGHGRIAIKPYYFPGDIEPTWHIDHSDPDTLLISGSVSIDTEGDSIPSRTLVIYTDGDQEIIATSERSDDSEFSLAQRGYTITAKYQLNDMSPATKARAQKIADNYLNASDRTTLIRCMTLYFDAVPGEILMLTLPDGRHRCQIRSIDPLDLRTGIMSLTLKELEYYGQV